MKKTYFQKKHLLFFVLMLAVLVAEARFGGGGGGGSSDYSSGGGYSSSDYSSSNYSSSNYSSSDYSSGSHGHSGSGSPGGMVLLCSLFAGAILLINFYKYISKEVGDNGSAYSSLPRTKKGIMSLAQKQDKLSKIKDFNEKQFLEKARHAFEQMQDSWAKKDLALARRFMTDGMYQRVNAQLIMMNKLGQVNEIDSMNLADLRIAFVERKEPYDMIYVEYKAFVNERYKHPVFKELNHSYRENFTEYWTFIRKTDHTPADLYTSKACPKCGAPLEHMGEVSKCHSCSTYTNTGEFDWVISEVIQPDAFAALVDAAPHYNSISTSIGKIRPVFPAINVPALEDKAANAFLQVKVATALNDPKRIRRFSADQFFDMISASPQEPFAYNRLFIHKVSLINIFDTPTHYQAAFKIRCTEQKVRIKNDQLELLDRFLVNNEEYLVLTIQKNNSIGQHSVFSYTCASCGGNLQDTGDVNCPYCHNILNDDTRDWLVLGLYNYTGFVSFRSNLKASPRIAVAIEQTGKPMQPRDYALNNILVILHADGQLSTEEKKFAVRTAKLLKYRNEELNILWENRLPERLGIKMPEGKKQQQRIYNLMKKAAHHDDHLAVQELEVLDAVRIKYQLKA